MSVNNNVRLIGRLTRDSELKKTSSGYPVSKFSIAVNKRKKQGDQWIDEAHFFDCILWGKRAESLNQYLLKGVEIAIDGELVQNRWEQDGQKRSKLEININDIKLLGGKSGKKQEPENNVDEYEDDIPF